MRAYLDRYEMITPSSLKEALELLERSRGELRPFAGGTDLMVLFEAGKLEPKRFLNLWSLDQLRQIELSSSTLTLGSLCTYSQIQANKTVAKEFSLLISAAEQTGAIAIQNRGTIGGNIANASPAADSPPALLVYDAEIELMSAQTKRWVKLVDFYLGYKKTQLRSNELISKIRLERNTKGYFQEYRKVGTRKAQAISKTCLAAMGKVENSIVLDTRIALGSVAPTAIRCRKTEEFLVGKHLSEKIARQASLIAQTELSPIDDIRSTRDYRMKVSLNLIESFLIKLKTECGTGSKSSRR